MNENNFEEMLKKTMNLDSKKAKPCRWFAFKMQMRLRGKSWQIGWHEAMSGSGKFKFAGVGALVLVMTMGGGVGAYAYTSPDVTVMHPLYPIKQGIESTEVYLAPSPGVKAEILLRHARRRTEEMRKMGEIMDPRGGADFQSGEAAEEGMKRTMQMVRLQMNDSLVYAADQDSVDEARAMMELMHKNLEEMDAEIGGMYGAESLRERQMIRAHMEDLRQYTKLKMRKVDRASKQMVSPMRVKGPRAIMRCLTDEGAGLDEMKEDGVLQSGAPLLPDSETAVGEDAATEGFTPPGMHLRFNN